MSYTNGLEKIIQRRNVSTQVKNNKPEKLLVSDVTELKKCRYIYIMEMRITWEVFRIRIDSA